MNFNNKYVMKSSNSLFYNQHLSLPHTASHSYMPPRTHFSRCHYAEYETLPISLFSFVVISSLMYIHCADTFALSYKYIMYIKHILPYTPLPSSVLTLSSPHPLSSLLLLPCCLPDFVNLHKT